MWAVLIGGLLTSIVAPMFVTYLTQEFLSKPTSTVKLTYDIIHTHYFGEFLADIEVTNVGEKLVGNKPAILELKYRGTISGIEWKQEHNDVKMAGGVGSNIFQVEIRNFGPTAKLRFVARSKTDLEALPLLKHVGRLQSPELCRVVSDHLAAGCKRAR